MSGLRKILIYGSHGEFEAWSDGTPIDPPKDYSVILQIDFEEWQKHYGEPLPDRLDILDVGYWYEEDGKREYEPPIHDWNKD